MLDTRVEVRSQRTADDVFAYVADGYFEHHARYDTAVIGMIRTSEPPTQLGSTGVEVRRFVTRQEAAFVITEFQRPRRFSLRNASGPFELDRSYVFEPEDGGTRIAFTFAMRAKGGPLRWLFPLMRSRIQSAVQDNIERLRNQLDAGGE